ncbi:dihydrofolate reductase family protein [Agrococcus sp. 1P02AA]|uniref:dihydrofolate reductase family protein n=1 Tax=Agrococcus sp. 1P02AA TaxID=3132259 RepID=UPI0039A5BF8D
MSRIVVSTMLSIDGYADGPGGDVSAMPMDQAFSAHNVERVRAAGHLLFGGKGYREMLEYWPARVGDPDASPDDAIIAARYAAGIPITVISDSLTRADVTAFEEQTTIVRRADAHAAIAALRASGDEGDVLLFGGLTLWTDLLHHGLIDQLHLMIGPRVVAGDHRAFQGLGGLDLELLGVRTWADSRNVVLTYAPTNGAQHG